MNELPIQPYVLCGTKHIFSSAYHPDTNSEVEKMNNTLTTHLRMYVDEGHFDWDRFLPYAVFSVNTHVNESIGISPFYAVFGRNAKMPIDLDFIPQMEEPQAVITMLDHATPNIVLQLHEKEEDQTTYDNLRESSIMKFCHQFKNQQPQTAQKPHALNPIQMQDWTEKQTEWSQPKNSADARKIQHASNYHAASLEDKQIWSKTHTWIQTNDFTNTQNNVELSGRNWGPPNQDPSTGQSARAHNKLTHPTHATYSPGSLPASTQCRGGPPTMVFPPYSRASSALS